MVWNAQTPFRTGVPSVLNCVSCVLDLMATYKSIMKDHSDASIHTYIDALETAANDFRDNVPHPREGL